METNLADALTSKGLSGREVEIAELVVKGLANKEVASRLFITEKTVKFHLTNIYKKMSFKSRAQLIVWSMPHIGFQTQVEKVQDAIEPEVSDGLPSGRKE